MADPYTISFEAALLNIILGPGRCCLCSARSIAERACLSRSRRARRYGLNVSLYVAVYSLVVRCYRPLCGPRRGCNRHRRHLYRRVATTTGRSPALIHTSHPTSGSGATLVRRLASSYCGAQAAREFEIYVHPVAPVLDLTRATVHLFNATLKCASIPPVGIWEHMLGNILVGHALVGAC